MKISVSGRRNVCLGLCKSIPQSLQLMSQSYSHATFDQGAEYNTTFTLYIWRKKNSVMQTLWISRSLFRIENAIWLTQWQQLGCRTLPFNLHLYFPLIHWWTTVSYSIELDKISSFVWSCSYDETLIAQEVRFGFFGPPKWHIIWRINSETVWDIHAPEPSSQLSSYNLFHLFAFCLFC